MDLDTVDDGVWQVSLFKTPHATSSHACILINKCSHKNSSLHPVLQCMQSSQKACPSAHVVQLPDSTNWDIICVSPDLSCNVVY